MLRSQIDNTSTSAQRHNDEEIVRHSLGTVRHRINSDDTTVRYSNKVVGQSTSPLAPYIETVSPKEFARRSGVKKPNIFKRIMKSLKEMGGLGDLVGKVISKTTGIKPTGDCGCNKRKAKLNEWVPFHRKQDNK